MGAIIDSIAENGFSFRLKGRPLNHVPCSPQQRTCFTGVTIGSPTCLHHKPVFNLHVVHTIQECDLHVGASIGWPTCSHTFSYAGLPFIWLSRSDNYIKYAIYTWWRTSVCPSGANIGSPTCLHHKPVFNLHVVHTLQECDLHVGTGLLLRW